jgi:hypothetical protein
MERESSAQCTPEEALGVVRSMSAIQATEDQSPVQIVAIYTFCVMILVGIWGCAVPLGPPASPVQHSLDLDQAAQARHILAGAMLPVSGPALTLVPASGIRWSDIERAAVSAGKKPDTSFVVVASIISPDRGILHLRTAEGWPIAVLAQKAGATIDMKVVIGPYPVHGADATQAKHIEQAIHAALLAWGRKPSLASMPE